MVNVPAVSVRVVAVALTVIAPLSVRDDVELFSMMLVTFAPNGALMVIAPVPVPLLVTVPALLILVPDKVIPLAIALLLLMIKFPVPVVPPETVNRLEPLALLLTNVVPPEATVIAPATVNAEVALFSVIVLTLELIGLIM